MAHFILLDNWLRDVGGHNFQYCVDILHAAEDAGWQPVLVTHRDFQPTEVQLPSSWIIKPRFQFGWERRYCAAVDGTSRNAIGLDGRHLPSLDRALPNRLVHQLRNSLDFRQSDRQRRIDDYVNVCKRLFTELGFDPAARVFAPTVSDFDFIALAKFLREQPRSKLLDWHLQFHFDIAKSRKPHQEAQQQRLLVLRRQFVNALGQLPEHRIHFYATTPQIAGQYNVLRAQSFQPLPYAVNGDLFESAREWRNTARAPRAFTSGAGSKLPLRVTFAGVVRREKGKRRLKELTRRISEGPVGDRLQLWLQGSADSLARVLPTELRNKLTFSSTAEDRSGPIVAAKYPLARTDYLELIRRANVGVFPYDVSRYHARCSGVLVEMLAAGVPVIVPAGCWLADQISERNYQHLDKLSTASSVVSRLRTGELSWIEGGSSRPQRGKTEVAIAGGACAELIEEAPADANEMLFSFVWGQRELGDYARLELTQFDAKDQQIGRPWTEILSPRGKSLPAAAKFRLHAGTRRFRLRTSNAYDTNPLSLRHAEARFLSSGTAGSPAGSIGLIAGDWRQIPDLLHEMTLHYEHYRNSAIDFSVDWNQRHAAMRTVEAILSNSEPVSQPALCEAA